MPITDEEKMAYYRELMNQTNGEREEPFGFYEPPDFSNIGGVDISGDDYPGTMGEKEQLGMLERLFGRWDNRLRGGERRAREQAGDRARRDTIRRLQRRSRGRAFGGIIGLQRGGRYPDTIKGRARQAAYDKKHPTPQYDNTAASQNLSYLQQQENRAQQRQANTVRPANTGVERDSQRRKREKEEQEQQDQQGPPAFQTQVTSYGVPQQTAQQWANLTDRIVGEGQR